ncbi:MAG: glycosyltransferase [Clostridium sp.]|nr:glycosyltransferase [Clostridium sp.]
MEKVNILVSTYNGMKYLQEQMESLLNQDYSHYEIHIRDDGSKDGTVELLQQYAKEHPNKVFVYEGENLGYKLSFQWLMQHCGQADFFSFCDQDDYWYPDKVSRAVELLRKRNQNIPLIYLCDFYWCDGEMNRQRRNNGYAKYHSLEKYITLGDRNAFGFTEVFNKQALECVKDSECFAGCSHDEIVYMYCLCNGEIIWDDKVCADFRRHGNNTSETDLQGGSKIKHFLWRIKTFLLNSEKAKMYERMKVFFDGFYSELGEYEKSVYELYLGEKGRLKKAFMRKRYRDSLFDEISIRILFLLGRV